MSWRRRYPIAALLSLFPIAYKLYTSLTADSMGEDEADVIEHRVAFLTAVDQTYLALTRSLSEAVIPKSIKTNDLLSPVDGKPLSYSFDGRRLIIKVSGRIGDTEMSHIEIPPQKKTH